MAVTTEQTIVLVDARGTRVFLAGTQMVFGRSAECNARLNDDLVSRRHFAVVRTPAGWELKDLGSTHGTFLNGRRLRPEEMVPLALSDKIGAGHTTFVVQLAQSASNASAQPPVARVPAVEPHLPALPGDAKYPRPGPALRANPATPAWYWVTVALVPAAIVSLAIGAFLPWLQVVFVASLQNLPISDLLSPLLQLFPKIAPIVQPALSNPALYETAPWVIWGMETPYGPIVLLVAGLATVILIADLVLRARHSMVAGIAYLALTIIPGIMILIDLGRVRHLTGQQAFFGLNLAQIADVASKIVETKVTLLAGLYLTIIALIVLLIAGLIRIGAPLFSGIFDAKGR